MIKAPTSSPLAAAAAVLVVVSAWGADATIETTCRDAGAGDRRVDVAFCVRQFLAYEGAAEADTWGLAKTAVLIGINLADDAIFDLTHGKILPEPKDKKAEAAMDACVKAYDKVGLAFAEASDELRARRYPAAKEEMASVAPLLQRCDGGLVKVGLPSPLPRYSADCLQTTIIGIAITNLVK
ncbi:pectinesterase inhibitor 8-like [Triticum urartu]|uniref:Pectinesterase inhibitor domain-containing protein n=2 Tax=Triticum aestivum TaxID=4565 RepID=A0A3B5XWC1_WHEAT|nr:pectinesterase inhibitor 8-like [Triticum dicoccoides]XP_048534970.1 pectinesterase inhibitor 8-like [Triticum urartu]